MSKLGTDTGQIQARPTTEGQQDIRDKDADSDRRSRKKHQIIVGFSKPIWLRLIIIRMINICKEIGLMLLIAFTYAALTNDPPKISRSPAAYPFFPRGSVVKDYYRGDLTKAIEEARQSDIAFVMFYAPWDAESQEVKKEFEITAKYMQKLVTFRAINCWQPNGECRSHYSKVYNWPILIAYLAHGRGIQYNGPKYALHMIRFLNSIMEPVVRVNNLDVQHLRQKHDAVVVANVIALPGSLDYAIFYSTALRYLERDPFQDVIFAVNTEYTTGAKLTLYIFNTSMIYLDRTWKVESLLNWVHRSLMRVTLWASPSGAKSQQLSGYIQPGPALILFTPRNPLYEGIDYYDMLHEIGLQYFYCKNDKRRNFGTYLLSLGIHYSRLENYRKMKTICTSSSNDSPKKIKAEFPSTVTYLNRNKWSNNSYCISPANKGDTCLNNDIRHIMHTKFGWEDSEKYSEQFEEIYKNKVKRDMEEKKRKNAWVERDYILESYKNVYKTSMITGVNDARSPKNLYKIRQQNRCRLKSIAEKYSPQFFSESIVNGENNIKIDITGLSCQVNTSLSIIAMDSLLYHHFATSLSIDILNKKHKTALVILDEKMESYYVLDDIVTDTTAREFIRNFSENHLKRTLAVSSGRYNYTHVYTSNTNDGFHNRNYLSVRELDSTTFLPTVMQKNKAVVVLYHSKQCSFCNGISYVFLSTAKVLSSVTNLEFARIDGDLNTLPWEYTMESYPTILFFPDIKKSESRVFPKDTSLTVSNLINFILSNLNPSLRVNAMWSLCNHTKFKEEQKSCIAKVRIETLSLIERTLKEWRASDLRKRAVILGKLRELKHLHLLLAHLPANTESIQKCLRRLQRRMSFPSATTKKKIRKSSVSL